MKIAAVAVAVAATVNDKKKKHQNKKQESSFAHIDCIATDDGSWGVFAKAKVERLNVQATDSGKGGGGTNNDDNMRCPWDTIGRTCFDRPECSGRIYIYSHWRSG
jgi:hypothetical protein